MNVVTQITNEIINLMKNSPSCEADSRSATDRFNASYTSRLRYYETPQHAHKFS
jgi:hypothetical protein